MEKIIKLTIRRKEKRDVEMWFETAEQVRDFSEFMVDVIANIRAEGQRDA